MRTLKVWIFVFAALAGLSFGQSANTGQSLNPKAATAKAPPSCAAMAGWNGVEGCGGIIFYSNSIVDASVFGGADACARITNALTALNTLPGDSGTIDARGITGLQSCSANPFAGFSGEATLLLGAATYQTTATWAVPNRSRVLGIGASDSSTTYQNTTIQWVGSANQVVMSLGTAGSTSANFGVFVGDLTIDCNSFSGSIGLQNEMSQEESGANDITFRNCNGSALDLEPNSAGGAQNSGPYTNLNIKYSNAGACTSSTVPVKYNGAVKRGIIGLSVVAEGCTTTKPTVGVDINGGATTNNAANSADVFQEVHCENVGDCIRIGDAVPISNVVVAGVDGCPNNFPCANVVHICSSSTCAGGGGAADIVVEGIGMGYGSSPTGNLLLDDVTSTTIHATDSTGPSTLGFYALGHGTDPTLISSSPVVTPQFNSHLGTGNKDTAGTCTLTSGSCPTIHFATGYNSTPVCTATVTTSIASVRANPALTSLSITSSASSGTVSYICMGNPN
jgi:hypothetical protein